MGIEYYSKYFMYGGMLFTVTLCVIFFFWFRGDKTDIAGIKTYMNSAHWQGEVIDSRIEFWRQTNARYGNDYFYDITFYLNGDEKLHTAQTLIRPSQMHLMKKGLKIKVKKGSKNQLAVIEVDFDEGAGAGKPLTK
ncbi:hypothetical protein [Enterobacter sp. Bisph1]|uniref:hypothetical protein n=1 Tax=Enterobacter sp. Bisph1 TaxID=1274399 RepID=UPI00057BD0F8|nr:hypothetical protein [Enterobacter sp. Bisph1]